MTALTTTHRCELVPITIVDHAPLVTRILPAPPRCSRCRSRKVFTWASLLGNIRYERMCSRCITWSRTTRRDPLRCLDCRQWLNPAFATWSENDLAMMRRYGRVDCRRCERCADRKRVREREYRREEQENQLGAPLNPFGYEPAVAVAVSHGNSYRDE